MGICIVELTEEEKKKLYVDTINSIKKKYPALRQKSKSPTFALTYNGTPKTLMEKFKFTKEEAQKIYDRFHELYKESDRWVNSKIEEASHQGYITGAFGLRVRTPKLHASILGSKATPVEVAAEARTAANFLGQSYCMLLSRAASEVNKQVRASDKADMIVPVAQIHDAMYYLVKRDPSVLDFLHRIMLKAISWQEDPVIYHDKVKLTGNLSLFDPSWAIEHEIPNDFTYDNFVEYLKNE